MSQWFHKRGTTGHDGWLDVIDDLLPGWEYAGLSIGELADGKVLGVPAGRREHIVVPLSGSFRVDFPQGSHGPIELAGRESVFAGPTDVAYLGAGHEAVIRGQGSFALTSAPARSERPCAYLAASDVPVEVRGAGTASRVIRNFGEPGVLEADSIIACEVLTPAGNWSSYPPHKHDQEIPGKETALEEIYYFAMRSEQTEDELGANKGPGIHKAPHGYQRVSASDGRPIDVLAEVGDGDIVLVPYGWHGPSMAPPGYDMYYLNVMAGPGAERAWRISDHPDQAWVRELWKRQKPLNIEKFTN